MGESRDSGSSTAAELCMEVSEWRVRVAVVASSRWPEELDTGVLQWGSACRVGPALHDRGGPWGDTNRLWQAVYRQLDVPRPARGAVLQCRRHLGLRGGARSQQKLPQTHHLLEGGPAR